MSTPPEEHFSAAPVDVVEEMPNVQNGSDEELDDGGLQDDMDDLFGDDVDEEAEENARRRQLQDDELESGNEPDSGDDQRRDERSNLPLDRTESVCLPLAIARHPLPEPSDGETYLLKIPRFAAIDPVAFTLQNFQPPTTDHHSSDPPSNGFSAFKTAQSTIRWRHSPSDAAELQSNARILRWSDGSLTLQLAADPTVQYDIAPKALAPPQRNPPKPTPTSIHDKTGRPSGAAYDEKADAFTYLASASEEAFMVRVTNKITTMLSVVPSTAGADEALERLQHSMAALNGGTGTTIVSISEFEDPEMAKKKAELAEKEKLKAQRRLETQQMRERDRTNKVFARGGVRASGLTVGGLEDEEGGGGGARRAPRANKPRRKQRNDEYSSEEEYGGRGRAAGQDEYDANDDFIAASDEDDDKDADAEEDEDIDAVIENREKEQREQAQRAGTPKRDRPSDGSDEGEGGDAADSPVKSKRRRVVEEDDDE